jgi:DMSO/TMAO reductase YedYZ heme-binding membrane subunit
MHRTVPPSPWKRIRRWRSAACLLMALGALWAAAAGHLWHAGLLAMAALALFGRTIWGRRLRARARHDARAAPSTTAPAQDVGAAPSGHARRASDRRAA